MKVGVPVEIASGERRVALVPDAIAKLAAAGVGVAVEAGAGLRAAFPDEAYADADALIVADAGALYAVADVVAKVQPPAPEEVERLRAGQTLIAFLQPLVNQELARAIAQRGATAFSMDAIPRITRAQSMDALSSQATVAGYKAVLLAAGHSTRFFPMLMTAAGTIPPAKALVLGAGVAGLQAIATARRLGAIVSAFDTRPVVKEQVESLGATFLQLEVQGGETQGGYATALSEEQHKREQELIETHAAQADAVITTALIPGRPAPVLITEQAVRSMRPGSVIVDLAAEMGGNCALTEPGQITSAYGITLIGLTNLPSTMPTHASQMYSRNVQTLLAHLVDEGRLVLDFDDEITRETCVTHEGRILKEAVPA
jgi:proton-translocating NAD(P)+ transhydrogenase subunit alpha